MSTSSVPFASTEHSTPYLPTVRTAVHQALADQRLVGTVVLVAVDGQLVHVQAAGLADRENTTAMRSDTIFRLASVSKPIVSTAAMVLAARQRLDLDASIAIWLPDFRVQTADGEPAHITARQLLSHTAGLGYRFLEADAHGPYGQAGVSDGMDDSSVDLMGNLRRIASVPLLYAPGCGWGYSLATDVVGALVERVHGQPLGMAVRELVTGPLGMTDTDFHACAAQRVATAYVNGAPSPHRLREGETVSPFEGAVGIRYSPQRVFNRQAFASAGAGMAGTATDVLKLLEALRQGTLLPDALTEQMACDHAAGLELPNAPGFGFGLGFSVLRDPALAATPESPGTWRWGGAYGHSWFVDRARRLSVVALSNTLYEGMSGRFVSDVRDAVYTDLGGCDEYPR
ncbi:serine hydrolase domain-containing protein [Pseudomonas putida]